MTPGQGIEFAEVDVPQVYAAQVPGEGWSDPASIASALEACFSTAMSCVDRHGLAPIGEPRVIYTFFGSENTSFHVAIPIEQPPDPVSEPGVNFGMLEGQKMFRFTHHGSFQERSRTYVEIFEFMKAKGWISHPDEWTRYMPMWEEYVSDPEKTPEDERIIYIYLPAR